MLWWMIMNRNLKHKTSKSNFKQNRIQHPTISKNNILKSKLKSRLKSNSLKLKETSLNSLINFHCQTTLSYCAHSNKHSIKHWIFATWDRCKTYIQTSNQLSKVKQEGNLHFHIWGKFSPLSLTSIIIIGRIETMESVSSSFIFHKTQMKF